MYKWNLWFYSSYVRVGDLDLDDDVKDGASPLDILVDQVIFHAQYDNDKRLNDIGLLKLMQKVKFTGGFEIKNIYHL